jgi:hypothetical protein
LELHFLIGDQVFLRGGEGDRMTIFIGRGGHCLQLLLFLCDVKFQFYRVYIE